MTLGEWLREMFLETPDGTVWEAPLFAGEWTELQNKLEWYESPQIVQIYEGHKQLLSQNMDLGSPTETHFEQNIDSGGFGSTMHVTDELPSGRGEMKLEIEIETQIPPSGDNNYGTVEYIGHVYVRYDLPSGISFLPKIIANPLNRFFRRVFEETILEGILVHDTEYARERLADYFNYLRKYHGEEPVQTKTNQLLHENFPEEREFFE
ncbi:MAG: hypothetical protein ABEK01_01035 [Candidatus Nanohaloarchaea archaeon]